MTNDLELAIQMFRNQASRYRRYERYYKGEHDLSFATEKFESAFGSMFREFAMNLCPAIVDAVKDKLKIEGFGGEKEVPIKKIDEIWRRNRMELRAGEIHKEALKCGDSYAVVWFDPTGKVTIYPQRADRMMVKYNDEIPGRMDWAAKWWQEDDKSVRLNIFYPDRTEKYVSSGRNELFPPEARDFSPLDQGEKSSVPNPYGIVPVFHFSNNSDIGSFGESELISAIPIQDGMNKSILDMLVAMEYSAFRQRWIAGMEVEKDEATGEAIAPFQHGVERLWVATDAATRFGDFNTSDLEQFLKVKDGFRIDMASVTGTPLYYLMPQIRGFPSGESLRKAETRFLAKVRDRQEQFGAVWADVMSFALRLAGFPDISLSTQWEDPSPMNERDVLENLRLKLELGVPPEQVLREAGY